MSTDHGYSARGSSMVYFIMCPSCSNVQLFGVGHMFGLEQSGVEQRLWCEVVLGMNSACKVAPVLLECPLGIRQCPDNVSSACLV